MVTTSPRIVRDNSRFHIAKDRVEVSVIMADGSSIDGHVFLSDDERVSDLLNSNRMFFPLELESNELLLINKTSIALCKPIDRPD